MARCAGGGIMWSSVATRYQLGFARHAGSVTVPLSASTPHGTCESAMNAASSAGRSAANESANFSRSRKRNPSTGGSIGGTGAPGGGSAIRVFDRLARVGGEGGDVDEAGAPLVHAGLADDRAAVGMAGGDRRPIQLIERVVDGLDVAFERE